MAEATSRSNKVRMVLFSKLRKLSNFFLNGSQNVPLSIHRDIIIQKPMLALISQVIEIITVNSSPSWVRLGKTLQVFGVNHLSRSSNHQVRRINQ